MKLVFLNIYQGLVNRGAERSTEQLCERLSGDFNVTLIQGGKAKAVKKYNIITIPVSASIIPDSSGTFLRKFYLDYWSLRILIFTVRSLPLLLKNNPDIILPVNGGWQSFICKIVCFFKKAKLVIIGRAGLGRDDAWNISLRPDLFVALTKRGEDWAKSVRPSVKVVCIPNGVDLKDFAHLGPKAVTGLKNPLIIASGALVVSKQLEFTIKAASLVKSKPSLLILGAGPLYDELRAFGNKNLGTSRFKIIDVNPMDMSAYYRSGNLFTLASYENEAFGNVYLEAMACGLGIVAPKGYREDLLDNAGIFFMPGNLDDYASALELGLERKFGDRPRFQAAKYSWDEIIKKYKDVLSLDSSNS